MPGEMNFPYHGRDMEDILITTAMAYNKHVLPAIRSSWHANLGFSFQFLQICKKHLLMNDPNVFSPINNTKIPQAQLREQLEHQLHRCIPTQRNRTLN